jgi:hypothetical protein
VDGADFIRFDVNDVEHETGSFVIQDELELACRLYIFWIIRSIQKINKINCVNNLGEKIN